MLLADHPGPAPEHRRSDNRGDDPAVPAPIDVGRGSVEAAVEGRDAIDAGQRLLDQGSVGKRDRGAQQRALDLLATAGLAALDQCRQGAERR